MAEHFPLRCALLAQGRLEVRVEQRSRCPPYMHRRANWEPQLPTTWCRVDPQSCVRQATKPGELWTKGLNFGRTVVTCLPMRQSDRPLRNKVCDLTRADHLDRAGPKAHQLAGVVQRRHVGNENRWRARRPGCWRIGYARHRCQHAQSCCCCRCDHWVGRAAAHTEWHDVHHWLVVHDVGGRLVA